MSQPPPPVPPGDDLQFDTAEPAAGTDANAPPLPAATCALCTRPITAQYYAAADKIVCPQCRDQYVASQATGPGAAGLVKAGILGAGAAVIGAVIWAVVGRVTEATIGLIAIVVGLLVGAAVRAGSGGRGGREYQILAVLLTYLSICLANLLILFSYLPGEIPLTERARFIVQMIPDALVAPFRGGAQNVIGILIIGFALWEAWQLNRRRAADLAGPYAMAVPTAPPLATPGAR